MDNSGERKESGGRGHIMMMLKMRAEKEAAAKAAAAAAAASFSLTPSVSQQSIQQQESIPVIVPPSGTAEQPPTPPMSATRGRGNLLALLKKQQESASRSPASSSISQPLLSAPVTMPASASAPVSLGQSAPVSLGQSTPHSTVMPRPPKPMQKPMEPENLKGASEDGRGVLGRLAEISIASESSQSEIVPIQKQGTSGKRVTLGANYINITRDPEKGLFMYEVKFKPDIDSRILRRKLLNQHSEILGNTRIFDGTLMYLPQRIDCGPLESLHPTDGTTVMLTFIYKKEQTLSENIPFFNVLLGRVMRSLSLIRIGLHNFNPNGVKSVPQHKLEVWPGYVTAISEFEGGLKLCVDSRHRVMRTETVRDLIISQRSKSNFKGAVQLALQSVTVLTRYNNATYRIDDIDWDRNPMSTFKKNDTQMTLVDYYKTHWNVQIQDTRQPLLVHRAKRKTPSGETEEVTLLLVPELCFITGLTDDIRSDFRVMKDLDAITKAPPNERRDVIRDFVRDVKKSDVAREIFAEWGLELSNDIIEFQGRTVDPEEIIFGKNRTCKLSAQKPADWTRAACTNPMLRTPHLRNWFVVFCQKDTRNAREFSVMLRKVSEAMGMNVNEPRAIALQDDRIDSYLRELKNNIQHNVELAVIIFPTNRTDRYTAVKRICCVEMPIPSQVIMSRTIGRPDKLKSITEKIALQINCKLGGALWSLAVPMDNFMICGIDVYHGPTGSNSKASVAGFVASLDKALTTWHSRVCIQGPHQEIIDLLQNCFISALKAYAKRNSKYPDRIIVYRDGVGEGQIETVTKYEVKQLLAVLRNSIEPNYNPKLSVIIVQKRINTRLFLKCQNDLVNPTPGTIADTVITKKNLYDFFLVSQNVRNGTVSPTHYIVIHDGAKMKAEHIQRLTYKLCHLYYNWPGTVKVPAPCQYAHKLVYLVGQSFCLEPHPSLQDTLFYL